MTLVKKIKKKVSRVFLKKLVSVHTQTITYYPVGYSDNWLSSDDELSRLYSENDKLSQTTSSYEFSIETRDTISLYTSKRKSKKNFLLSSINV